MVETHEDRACVCVCVCVCVTVGAATQGGDLYDAVVGVGRHSERAAADVMRAVLTAIGYCHAMGVAHRVGGKVSREMIPGQIWEQALTHATRVAPLACP